MLGISLLSFEVLSRLAPYFKIKPEPVCPKLGQKKLDALIEYDSEKAMVEVCVVQERWEELLAHGFFSYIPGVKVNNVLRNKFEGQLKEGKDDLEIPILIVLCLDWYMGFTGMLEAEEAIYDFYDIPGTEMVTAIGAYQRHYDKNDPFVGKLYTSCKPPTNKMSPKFRLRLECALFGNNSANEK